MGLTKIKLLASFFIRFASFVAAALALTIGVGYSPFWPLVYWMFPLFLPFTGYERSMMGTATIFSTHAYAANAAYLIVVAAVAAALSFKKTVGWSVAVWVITVGVSAAMTHIIINARGYYFWMDTP